MLAGMAIRIAGFSSICSWLHRPGPKSCVIRCYDQYERRNQLDIIMRVKACGLERRLPRRQVARQALFVLPSSQPKSDSYPGTPLSPQFTKGEPAPRKASVAIPLCQNTCGIALLYSCAILWATLLKDSDAGPVVFMYQDSVLASPSRTPYTGKKPSNSEIFVMSA